MADIIDPIRITGLREFSRNLKRMDGELPKAIRLAGNQAAEVVVSHARPLVPSGPAKGGHASSSIKARSTRTATRVSAGSKRYPYYAWLDFGGAVGKNKQSKRPFIKQGRYLWRAFGDNKQQVQNTLQDALTDIARKAGVDVE